MSIFTGAGVALITPMHEDGSINYDEMERIVNYQIENGTDAIIVSGTTGEASTMTHEEHIETIKACVEMTKKRIPVIAGQAQIALTRRFIYPKRHRELVLTEY